MVKDSSSFRRATSSSDGHNDDQHALFVRPSWKSLRLSQMQRQPSIHHHNRRRRRWILLGFAFITTALTNGTVYGWPTLRNFLLQEEGLNLSESELALIFTLGSWSCLASSFVFGVLRDKYMGTKYTAALSLLCVVGGNLGMAFAMTVVELCISFFLLGVGAAMHVCFLPVAGLFPQHTGLIVSLLTGAFQISAMAHLVLTSISQNRSAIFGAYAIVMMILLILSLVLLPKSKNYETSETKEDEDEKTMINSRSHQSHLRDEEDSGHKANEVNVEATVQEAEYTPGKPAVGYVTGHVLVTGKLQEQTSEDNGDDEEQSFQVILSPKLEEEAPDVDADTNAEAIYSAPALSLWNSILCAEYIFLVAWFSIILIPLQYYVATLGFQLELYGDVDGKFANIFSIVYAAAAVLSPVTGSLVLDGLGLGLTQILASLLSAVPLILFGAIAPQDNYTLLIIHAAVGMVSYSIGRMVVFASFFTNVGKRLGYTHYGTLTGLGVVMGGIVSLLQYPLITAATSSNHARDAVNLASGILTIVLPIPYGLWLRRREQCYSSAIVATATDAG